MQESIHNFLGVHINECCKTLVQEAQALKTEVYFIFNDVKIIANKDSDPVKLVNQYHLEMNKKHEEYKKTDEYKAQQKKDQENLSAAQIGYNTQMEKFETLDYSDHSALLQWICDVQDYTDHIGVQKDVGHILTVLSENGYHANMNLGDKLDKESSASVAEYIVGQAMSCLQEIGAIHGVVHRFTKDWKEKFN